MNSTPYMIVRGFGKAIQPTLNLVIMTYNCIDTTKSNTVITTILVDSGVEDEDTVFVFKA